MMITLLAVILLVSVSWLGGVSYWNIALCNLLCLAGIFYMLLSGLRRKCIVFVCPLALVFIAAAVFLSFLYMFFTPVFFYARREFLYISSCALVFFIVLNSVRSEKDLRWFMIIIVSISLLLACYGMYQFFFTPDKTYSLLKPFEYRGRASGSYLSPNHYGDYLAMCLCMVYCFFAWSLRVESSSGKKSVKYVLSVMIGLAFILIFLGMMLSFSRGAIISLVAALFIIMALLNRKNYVSVWANSIILICAVVAVGFIVMRINRSGVDKTATGDKARVKVLKDSYQLIKERPVTGHGPGSFRWMYPRYKSEGIKRSVHYAHNDYVHIVAETGILGLMLFLLIAFLIFKRALWIYRQNNSPPIVVTAVIGFAGALIAGLIHAFVDFNLHISANALLMSSFAGGIFACGNIAQRKDKVSVIPVRKDLAKACVWLAAFAVFLGMVYDGKIVAAAVKYYKAEEYARSLLWDEALSKYRRAFALDPENPFIAGKIADINYKRYLFERGSREMFRDETLAWYNIGIRLNPLDGNLKIRLATFCGSAGENDRAEELFNDSLIGDPNNWYFHRLAGIYYSKNDNAERSAQHFEKALKINPRDTISRSLLMKLRKGKRDDQ